KILKRHKMDNSKHGHIPMQERLDFNKTQGDSTPKEVKRMQNVPYASAVGSIINSIAELRVDCYCDAGFETDRDDTKSQTGYVYILNRGAVDWKSSKQSTTAMSPTEAEYIAASEAVWIRKFISGLDRSKRLIGLGQNAYMDKILKRHKMDNSKHGHIPMQERLDFNKTQGDSTPKEVKRMQNVPYASAVGSIINSIAELRVDCYCDAGFETDRDDTKSQTGYVYILNRGAVDWKSSKQSTTAMSPTEAEYIAASEAVWIRKFIS
nr:hypothetical protein [Tanacetum cinerariifolium]